MHVERVVSGCERCEEASFVRMGGTSLGTLFLRDWYGLARNAGAVMVVKAVLAGAE